MKLTENLFKGVQKDTTSFKASTFSENVNTYLRTLTMEITTHSATSVYNQATYDATHMSTIETFSDALQK